MKWIILSIVYGFIYAPVVFSHINKASNFLILSDIHLKALSKPAMEISPSITTINNDLDEPTFNTLLSMTATSIKKGVIPDPNFILILGDLVGHQGSSANQASRLEGIIFKKLKSTFPNTPIFYVFGNNDSLQEMDTWPFTYGPFSYSKHPGHDKSPFDIATSLGNWRNGFLSTGVFCNSTTRSNQQFPCLIEENKWQGYYSALITPGLRLIALNSVLYSARYNGASNTDGLDQFNWLSKQLKAVKAGHQQALIAMHISPGFNIYNNQSFWLDEHSSRFLNIVKTYHANIAGILASHTHTEEMKVIKDSQNNIISGLFFAPALSTSHGNNPALKTMYYAMQRGEWILTNYDVFHFSLEKSALQLEKLYDYKHYYCKPHQLQGGLLACLGNVTIEKMKQYYKLGNLKMPPVMKGKDKFIVTIP